MNINISTSNVISNALVLLNILEWKSFLTGDLGYERNTHSQNSVLVQQLVVIVDCESTQKVNYE